MDQRSKGETAFIDQMTRKLLVMWADHMVRHPDGVVPIEKAAIPYVQHAMSKGWVGKKTPHRLTSKGFQTAASFLKR